MGKFKVRKIGFLLGLIVLLGVGYMPTPEGLTVVGQRVLAVTLCMVVFWISEALPIPVTALLPIVLFPLMQITGSKGQNDVTLFENYAYSTCYLLVGVGFMTGAMVKYGLHKRIALYIVSKIGKKPTTMVLGFIIAVAFLSMFMSNTTCTVIMIPIAMAIAATLGESGASLKKAIILSIPYAATIGGMATVIGTTTNPTGISLIQEAIGLEIDFLGWLKIGLPFTIIIIPFFWIYMIKFFKIDKMEQIDITVARDEYEALGPINKGEKLTLLVFCLCIVLWVIRSNIVTKVFPYATDETIAILGGILTCLVPINFKEGETLMNWKDAVYEIPWNAVVLLGGSMVMGNAFKDAGCAAWVANLLSGLAGMNPVLIVIIVGIVSSFVTELTTNAVVVAAFLPVLASVGTAIGVSPLAMMVACMLACNFAFMLPPATPPNTIAYGTGEIEMIDLIKTGLGLKLICLVIFPIVLYVVTMGIFGVGA